MSIDTFRQQSQLLMLVHTKMPYGRFEGRYICDLPEPYLVWYRNKGFPQGQLGELLASMYEIKLNGLEYLLQPLRKKRQTHFHFGEGDESS